MAAKLLREAELVVVTLSTLCELVWVLGRAYKLGGDAIAEALVALVAAENVAINRPAVEAGIATLTAGGDFADGVVAYEGRFLGGETFVSFDRRAVSLLTQQRHSAQLLG